MNLFDKMQKRLVTGSRTLHSFLPLCFSRPCIQRGMAQNFMPRMNGRIKLLKRCMLATGASFLAIVLFHLSKSLLRRILYTTLPPRQLLPVDSISSEAVHLPQRQTNFVNWICAFDWLSFEYYF